MTATNCDPWPLTPECLPDGWDADDLTETQQAAVDRASDWLSHATGGVYGQCDYTSHHCTPTTSGNSCLPGRCRCLPECRFYLAWPAAGPVTVTTSGQPWSTSWNIIDEHTLTLGSCPPQCSTVAISYRRGWPVVAGDRASRAMTLLAVQLHRDPCYGTGRCAPPHGATGMQRDGWSVDLEPGTDAVFGDATGIRAADSLIDYAQSMLSVGRGVRVWSPDIPLGDHMRWSVTDSGQSVAVR